ncbi:unnamed protein product [Urochloa humidicola]
MQKPSVRPAFVRLLPSFSTRQLSPRLPYVRAIRSRQKRPRLHLPPPAGSSRHLRPQIFQAHSSITKYGILNPKPPCIAGRTPASPRHRRRKRTASRLTIAGDGSHRHLGRLPSPGALFHHQRHRHATAADTSPTAAVAAIVVVDGRAPSRVRQSPQIQFLGRCSGHRSRHQAAVVAAIATPPPPCGRLPSRPPSQPSSSWTGGGENEGHRTRGGSPAHH